MITALGFQATSLVDYPGLVASTVFTHGCPLACSYCHNQRLRGGPVPTEFVTVAEVLARLERRRRRVTGLCVSGGEPLVHSDLTELTTAAKALGYRVKVDTAGIFPDRLKHLLAGGTVDMVALDIKTDPARYDVVGGSGVQVLQSLDLLRSTTVDYELRTTLAPGVVDDAAIEAIARLLQPDETVALAQYRPTGWPGAPTESVPQATAARWQARLADSGATVALRGYAG